LVRSSSGKNREGGGGGRSNSIEKFSLLISFLSYEYLQRQSFLAEAFSRVHLEAVEDVSFAVVAAEVEAQLLEVFEAHIAVDYIVLVEAGREDS
jgi:hypothetical protein